jgi:hypothetical protein
MPYATLAESSDSKRITRIRATYINCASLKPLCNKYVISMPSSNDHYIYKALLMTRQ